MSEPKLCPFRRAYSPYEENTSYAVYDYGFAPCLEDKCAMWRIGMIEVIGVPGPNSRGTHPYEYGQIPGGWCGLAGKL